MSEDPNPVLILLGAIAVLAVLGIAYVIQKKKERKSAGSPVVGTASVKEATPPAAEEKKAPMRLAKGAASAFGEPKNELEEKILAARNRDISMQQFLEYFLNAEAFVLAPEGQFEMGEDQKPRLVKNPSLFTMTYNETCLCFYSHTDRMKPTTDKYPDFRYGIAIKAGDFLSSIQGGFGVIINPLYDTNMEWSSDQVEAIKELIKK